MQLSEVLNVVESPRWRPPAAFRTTFATPRDRIASYEKEPSGATNIVDVYAVRHYRGSGTDTDGTWSLGSLGLETERTQRQTNISSIQALRATGQSRERVRVAPVILRDSAGS